MKVIDDFDKSFQNSIDDDMMKKYDGRVITFWRIVMLLTSIVGAYPFLKFYFEGPAVMFEYPFQTALSMFALAITAVVGVLFNHAKSENKVRLKLQIVIFGIVCLLFGIPGVTIQTLQIIVPVSSSNEFLWITATLLWYVGLLVWGIILDSMLNNWVRKFLRNILNQRVKPFNEIFANTFTGQLFRLRTIAFSVCILYASLIWIIIRPELLVFQVYTAFILVFVYFIGKPSEFDRYYYDYNEKTDLATFCLTVSEDLWRFGIRDFRVYYKPTSFSGHVSPFTTEIYPEGYEPLLIIHGFISILNYNKIQTHLGEQWNQDLKGRTLGQYLCPFREFEGRILVDLHVWDATKLLWWCYDHRFAIVISGSEIRRNVNVNTGDFTDLLTY